MKKIYFKPEVRVVPLRHRLHLLQGSKVDYVGGNSDLRYVGSDDGDEEDVIIR